MPRVGLTLQENERKMQKIRSDLSELILNSLKWNG
jgi:hypothetical protein